MRMVSGSAAGVGCILQLLAAIVQTQNAHAVPLLKNPLCMVYSMF